MTHLASKSNNRVTIQMPEMQRDRYGQQIKTWRDVATVWADVKFINGTEYQKTQVAFGETTASVRLRLNQTTRQINHFYRLILHDWGNQIMAVEAVLPDLRGRSYVDLVCRIGRNDGE